MRHRLALVLTVIGAIALPVVMAATVLYASDAAIGDVGQPLAPRFGTTPHPTTGQTAGGQQSHPTSDDHGGATSGGGSDDQGGDTHGGGSSGGSGSSGSGSGSGSSGGSDDSGGGHGGHGGDD
jgi:hypothetical protein